jgi:hypothetical protein
MTATTEMGLPGKDVLGVRVGVWFGSHISDNVALVSSEDGFACFCFIFFS